MAILPALAAVFIFLAFQFVFLWSESARADEGILGGPEGQSGESGLWSGDAALVAASPVVVAEGESGAPEETIAGFVFLDSATLANSGSILGGDLTKRDGLMVYKVQEGDTLSAIAANFGISLNTILWANPSFKGGVLRPGAEFTILPVSGLLYEVKPGDTAESIVSAHGSDLAKFMGLNKLQNPEIIEAGRTVVVPDAKPQKSLASIIQSAQPSLPNLAGYFEFPAPKSSWNWGKLHNSNAIDIANSCGTSIYAAADGLVVDTGSSANWNGGYGGFVKVEHPNGTVTLYAHTQENLVSTGELINQGDALAKIGRTGNVHGPTGCHLHFEVHGAKNPFIK